MAMEYVSRNGKKYCAYCGKEQTELEIVTGQCNECDPFVDEMELGLAFGDPEYIETIPF